MRTAAWFLCGFVAAASAARAEDSPPAGPTAAKYQIDKDRRIFTDIRDGTPFQTDARNGEYQAYNLVLQHAREFPTAELEQFARRDVSFRDLFLNTEEFRLELVYLDGRLKQLRRTEPTPELKEAGVNDLYEGWLFPRDESNPVCLVVTELPPGLEAQKDLRAEMDRWVGVAGYFFKKYRYESRKVHPRDPSRHQDMLAPVLLGRSITPLAGTPSGSDNLWLSTFLPGALVGIGLLGTSVVVLTWYFRRGDREVAQRVAARRETNPFAE